MCNVVMTKCYRPGNVLRAVVLRKLLGITKLYMMFL